MLRYHKVAAGGTRLSTADAARALDGEDITIRPVARVWRHLDGDPLARGDARGGGAAGSGRGLSGALVPFDGSVRHAALDRQDILSLGRAGAE